MCATRCPQYDGLQHLPLLLLSPDCPGPAPSMWLDSEKRSNTVISSPLCHSTLTSYQHMNGLASCAASCIFTCSQALPPVPGTWGQQTAKWSGPESCVPEGMSWTICVYLNTDTVYALETVSCFGSPLAIHFTHLKAQLHVHHLTEGPQQKLVNTDN